MSRSNRATASCGLFLGIVVCLLVLIVLSAVVLIPRAVESDLGPPSPRLGFLQRILVTWQLFVWREELYTPVNPNGTPQVFKVRMGETANSVAARLHEDGIVVSAQTFRLYLVYSGLDTTIQAGEYQLSPAQTMVEVAATLQDATPLEVEFNILAGWRAEEIAAALPTSGLQVAPQGFLQVVRSPRAGVAPPGLAVSGSLEGYLLPGSYQLPRSARADDIVKLFVERFDEEIGSELRDQYQARGLSLQQAVTLASIVQREAVVEDEQPMIASVFYNRIAAGMRLESDPTVQYALGYREEMNTWWTNPLTANDMQVDSPYNTYRYPGLPPGPICNPGVSALRAVAYPAESPYFFFRAACDRSGRHNFATSFEEHLRNACP